MSNELKFRLPWTVVIFLSGVIFTALFGMGLFHQQFVYLNENLQLLRNVPERLSIQEERLSGLDRRVGALERKAGLAQATAGQPLIVDRRSKP